MNARPTQFELALLAMTLDGDHPPSDRVKLAMDVWKKAGEALFPAPRPNVAVSLEQMLEKLFPVVGNGRKKLSSKELRTARMGKYRRFLEWCEWAKWGPDFTRTIPNEKHGCVEEIPVIRSFVTRNVQAEITTQSKDGILDSEKVEEEFRSYCDREKNRREAVFAERAKKAAAASHAKKIAARSIAAAGPTPKKKVSGRKDVKTRVKGTG